MVAHFRDDVDLLCGLFGFIKDKKIKLYNNVANYCISENEYSIALSLDKPCLKQYAYKLLNQKIDIEMIFISAFLKIMVVLYANYRLEEEKILEPGSSNLLDYIGMQDNSKAIEKIRSELKRGYDNHDEERALKDSYLSVLEENYLFVNMLVKMAMKYNDPYTDLVAEVQNVFQEYKSDKTAYLQRSGQDNFLMGRIKNELGNASDFLKMAKPQIAGMFSNLPKRSDKKIFCPEQSKYIETIMFDAWIDRAKKIEKNDIFDMLFIGCAKGRTESSCVLEDTSPYLISFDKKVARFIKSINSRNGELIDSFYQ